MFNAGIESLLKGTSPWTMRNTADWSALEKLDEYASPDRGWVERTLPPRDRLASVFFAGNVHDEAQPVHLKVLDTSICVDRCTKEYGNPCENFCPAGVYEMVDRRPGRHGACRSTPRTACTARRATSRTRTRSSTGRRRKAAPGRTTRISERNL